MAGTQWENLPEPLPERPAPALDASWQGFTVDPRPPANQVLRAADADRDYATRLIDQARLDGRLSSAEHDDRAAGAGAARTLGELVPLVSDLMLPAPTAGHHGRHKRFTQAGAMGWIGLALLFNAIWLMTSISAARPIYYWPMWPMFFIGLPLVMSMFASRRSEPPPPPRQRQVPPGQDLR